MNEETPTKRPPRYCFNCSAQIDANAKICPKCGIGAIEQVSIADDEKIIKKVSEGWDAILKNNNNETLARGSMILTDKRIIIGDSKNSARQDCRIN